MIQPMGEVAGATISVPKKAPSQRKRPGLCGGLIMTSSTTETLESKNQQTGYETDNGEETYGA